MSTTPTQIHSIPAEFPWVMTSRIRRYGGAPYLPYIGPLMAEIHCIDYDDVNETSKSYVVMSAAGGNPNTYQIARWRGNYVLISLTGHPHTLALAAYYNDCLEVRTTELTIQGNIKLDADLIKFRYREATDTFYLLLRIKR